MPMPKGSATRSSACSPGLDAVSKGRVKRAVRSQRAQKLLDQFGRNLTRLAADGKLDPVVGRQIEIERVMQILSRRTKNNPVLIGEPGVGKTAVVEGLAARISSNQVPELLKGQADLHA